MEPSNLKRASFNCEQIDAFGKAQRVIADEASGKTKLELISYEPEEVIELLSESETADDEDDESDCEIFGEMFANQEDTTENTQTVSENKPEYVKQFQSNGVVEIIADEVIKTPNFILNNTSLSPDEQSTSLLDSFNDIIDLDDSDNDEVCDQNNSESSDEDVKEKKCIIILDDDSQGSNPPSTSEDAAHHSKAHNLEAFLNYICPLCGVSCGNIKKWNAHTDIVHNFRSISTLDLKTVISRHGQLLYECNTCSKKFISDAPYGILLNHRIQHMTIPNFLRCRLCEERFSSRSLFLKHFRKIHKKIALEKLRRSDSLRSHIRFMCPICNKKAEDLKEWRSHLKIEHDWCNKLDEKVYKIRDNLVECNTCLATFHSRHSLWHLVRHEKHNPFHCKLCEKLSSYNIHKIVKHIRMEHLKQKCKQEYRCNYCDKVFSSHQRRISHLNELHTIQKLTCEICDKEFNSSARLLAHMAKLNHQKIK